MSSFFHRNRHYFFRAAVVGTVIAAVILTVLLISGNDERTQNGSSLPSGNSDLKLKHKTVTMDISDIYKGPLMLVNNSNRCDIDGDGLSGFLDRSNGRYFVSDGDVLANSITINAANEMFESFFNVAGKTQVMVASCYRSYVKQQELYEEEQQNPSAGVSAAWVAKPGYSEHQTGYAMDLALFDKASETTGDYDGTGVYSYLNENCHKFGFIIRYASDKTDITGINYEPWHFRYVGIPHAVYMKQKNLCLEEYISFLKENTNEDAPLIISDSESGESWTVYRVASEGYITELPVPEEYGYEVSGDNCGGYIVTAEM